MLSLLLRVLRSLALVVMKVGSFMSDLSKYPGLGMLRPLSKAVRWPLTFIPKLEDYYRVTQQKVKLTRSKAKSLNSAVRSVGKK